MAKLESRTQLGASRGDVHAGEKVIHIQEDGKYVFAKAGEYPISKEFDRFDADGNKYTLVEFANGMLSVVNKAGEYSIIDDIPDDWIEFILAPTLPASTAVGFYWFDDSFAFTMNPHADGQVVNTMQIWIPQREYGQLTNVRLRGGRNLTDAEYQWQLDKDTGLYNHLFTLEGPFNDGSGVDQIDADAPNPPGPQSGGNNPDPQLVQTFSN